jgi:hypothetical protein
MQHTTTEVRSMLNGDGNHYDVSDDLRTDNTRYFKVRGDSDLLKTFRSLVENATDYEVVDVEDWGDRFKAEIELE